MLPVIALKKVNKTTKQYIKISDSTVVYNGNTASDIARELSSNDQQARLHIGHAQQRRLKPDRLSRLGHCSELLRSFGFSRLLMARNRRPLLVRAFFMGAMSTGRLVLPFGIFFFLPSLPPKLGETFGIFWMSEPVDC